MKYVNEDGEPISGFFELNKELNKSVKRRVCMNPECNDLPMLEGCESKRPIIHLGKKCWNCKQTEFLEEYNG